MTVAARTEDRSPPPRISDLPDYGLRCVDAAPACSRYDAAVGGRLRANPAAAAWIAENYGEHWNGDWFHVPIEVMQQAFTTEELLRLWCGSVIMSGVSEWVDEAHPFLRKIAYAHWHYSSGRDWNLLVEHLAAFRRLRVDIPGFELRLSWTRTINTAAWAEHLRDVCPLYLDASFGLLLCFQGKHVLTVGFAPCDYGIMVAQVQLREKKGNRFLYQLPGHYLDFTLGLLASAFRDPLWLVTGASATEAIRRSYGAQASSMTPEDEARIIEFYDRPLAKFARTEEARRCEGRTFVRLAPAS